MSKPRYHVNYRTYLLSCTVSSELKVVEGSSHIAYLYEHAIELIEAFKEGDKDRNYGSMTTEYWLKPV